jgi:aerobic-type carbon monoxide dehydrogenase small subunit (CoxS/CutS family)
MLADADADPSQGLEAVMIDEPMVDLDITVNGQRHNDRQVAADMTLVHFLHEVLGLTGTRIGCSIGECRACTVAVRPQKDAPVVTRQACMTAMRHTSGWEVTTVEGLSPAGVLNPMQEAILKQEAFQCGYCAAGFAVAGSVALASVQRGDDSGAIIDRVDAVLGPHICRCTGYGRYRDAIVSVAEKLVQSSTQHAVVTPAPESAEPPDDPVPQPLQRLTPKQTEQLGYVAVFDDPTLELIRLLRDGAEIEHSLLVQYLYAAFSVKLPDYAHLAGWPNHRYGGRPLHLMGVAIEEMTHLDVVNELLVALGAAPHLGRQQSPYEKDVYPFDFRLEPLSEESIAKYVYVEAPPDAVDPDRQMTPNDQVFVTRLYEKLGPTAHGHPRPNQVGSLYRKVGRVLELMRDKYPGRLDYSYWGGRLNVLLAEGESEHFGLFRSLFEGTHPSLPGGIEVWDPHHPGHPAIALQHNTGLPLSGEQIIDAPVPAMRHLANLHYWAVCMLLDLSYRTRRRFHSAARRHMAGPLRSLGSALATARQGVPFDVFVPGYAPGLDGDRNLDLTLSMLRQLKLDQEYYGRHLPPDYSYTCVIETIWELTQLTRLDQPQISLLSLAYRSP